MFSGLIRRLSLSARESARLWSIQRNMPVSQQVSLCHSAVIAARRRAGCRSGGLAADAAPASQAAPVRTQPARDMTTGAVSEWAVYDRAALAPGVTIAGPAIVAEDETSIEISPGWMAIVSALLYLDLTRTA